ncbi:MAG: Na/Pi symporter [Synergistaceae bacterium]|nr:Na/Pi symporter [Synergistaceae bacterium]
MAWLYNLIYVAGGLALFLFGVQESSAFFKSNFGGEFRDKIGRFTSGKYRSFLFGVLLSAITQSSTIATSFAVGFIDAGMLSFAGSIYVMMGASLGGTFVSFLLSLRLFDYAPLLFALGFFLSKVRVRCIWLAAGLTRCLALIFLGMLVIGMGTGPMFENEEFRRAVTEFASNPLATGLASFIGAGVLQSSSAIMALGITLAASGVLPASSALPLALGAHIGSTTMVLLAGLGGRLSAKRLGIATFFYKLLGGLLFIPFVPWVNGLMSSVGLPIAGRLVYGQLMIALFNMAVFLPFTAALSTFSIRLISGEGELSQPKYLDDGMISVPFIAVMLLSREMARLSNYIEAYLQMLLEPQQRDRRLFERLPEDIDELSEACQEYCYKLHIPADNPELKRRFSSISHTMSVMRMMSRSICGGLRELLSSEEVRCVLEKELGEERWRRWAKLARRMMRTSLRAFVIGEKALVSRAVSLEAEMNQMSGQIRHDLNEVAYDRQVSRAIRMISLMQSFLGMSKILAEDEETEPPKMTVLNSCGELREME